MTHIVRHMERPGSKLHKKEIAEGVSVLEAPPMVVVSLKGYVATPCGLRALTSVWAGHLSQEHSGDAAHADEGADDDSHADAAASSWRSSPEVPGRRGRRRGPGGGPRAPVGDLHLPLF